MNYHSDEWIIEKLNEHYEEARWYFPEANIVGIFVQGSQNYGLDYENSDLDTKLIVTPTLDDLVYNKRPASTTHVRENDEHIDFKDVRLYIECFKKQNLNFLEILFTPYKIVNPIYEAGWNKLVNSREAIAHMNPVRSVKSMVGVALEKYHALQHPYPSKLDVLAKYGYDCYHPDTLFLTKRGWLKYDEIVDTDELATCNPNTLNIEWQHYIDRIKKAPTSNVYKCETYNTSFCITETHNVFSNKIKNINKNRYSTKGCTSWELSPLKDCFKNKHRYVLSFPINNNEDNLNFSDEYLSLLGLFISDGTLNFRDKEKTIPKAIRLYQTLNGKKEFIELANSLQKFFGGTQYIDNKKTKCYVWIFSNTKLANEFYNYSDHISQNKHLPNWIYTLSQRQADILLKALLLGDGTFSKSRNIYYTSSKMLAYDVCTLAKLAGYTCNILGGENGYFYNLKEDSKSIISMPSPPMWQVQITKRKINNHFYFDYHENNRNGNIYSIEQPKQVVCFTVPNGTLVTMFNGKSAVQGNCKQLHHLLRVEDYLERYINGESYESCLQPTDPAYLLQVKKGLYNEADAVAEANRAVEHVKAMEQEFILDQESIEDPLATEILCEVQAAIMKKSIRREIENEAD